MLNHCTILYEYVGLLMIKHQTIVFVFETTTIIALTERRHLSSRCIGSATGIPVECGAQPRQSKEPKSTEPENGRVRNVLQPMFVLATWNSTFPQGLPYSGMDEVTYISTNPPLPDGLDQYLR